MRLLLDTHIAVWALEDGDRLSAHARDLIVGAADVTVSTVSVFEVAVKHKRHPRNLTLSAKAMVAGLREASFALLPLSPEHAASVEDLPSIHSDPFDRMLVAQALHEQLRLITHDKAVARYSDTFILV